MGLYSRRHLRDHRGSNLGALTFAGLFIATQSSKLLSCGLFGSRTVTCAEGGRRDVVVG